MNESREQVPSVVKRVNRVDASRAAAGIVLLMCLTSCSDILGFHEGRPSPETCSTNNDCAPREECKHGQCASLDCAPGERRCDGLTLMRCSDDETWTPERTCDAICSNNECKTPPSCDGRAYCAGNESCCQAFLIPPEASSATYRLKYVDPATVSEAGGESHPDVTRTIRPFVLDRYEVSVSRFAAFLVAYEQVGHPEPEAGRHPAFADSGWKAEWSADDGPLPGSANNLTADLRVQGQIFDPDAAGDLPVRGVNWYVAFAFCIWDGGRLPTEAEWAYAAFGGNDERNYPWATDEGREISHNRAVYSDVQGMLDKPEAVGSRPDGEGAFKHQDLAGNVSEWVADAYRDDLDEQCADATDGGLDAHECMQRTHPESRVIRGGSFKDVAAYLRNVSRRHDFPDVGGAGYGFRCARDIK